MAAGQIELRVALTAGDLDADGLAEGAAMLGEELAELDVDEVASSSAGDAPPGSKGIELAALGALVVKLAGSRKLLGQLVDTVRDWVSRNDAKSVRMEIDGDVLEVTGASTSERKALIDAWVQRHAQQ